MNAVFAAGLALLGLSAALDLAFRARKVPLPAAPYLIGVAASVCLTVAGAGAIGGRPVRLSIGGWLGTGTGGLAADRLSGLFLVIAFGAATAVSLAFASWAASNGPGRPQHPAPAPEPASAPGRATVPGPAGRRGLGAGYALTLAAVAVIVTATDAFTFLFAWEALTVAFYLLTGSSRGRAGRPGGAMATLAFGKMSGAALLAGLLLLAARSGSLGLSAFAHAGRGAVTAAAEALLLGGFAVKGGLVPFQVWMPRGYSAAPGPARAIMAGVAVNTGFYGMWRTLALLGPPPAWLTSLILVLAGLTGLLGIAHAATQPGLQRVIAYSSVENTGLIVAGFGVALTGAAVGDRQLVAAGLLAATLQIVTHTAAKSLLFTASAAIEGAAGTGDLDALHGTARRMPWSGTGLAIGSLTLAGLPLTAGFASEWFLLEALMQQFRVPGLAPRLVLAVAGAAVALTAGFAGVTFVRLTGLMVLGPRNAGAAPDREVRDYGWLGRAGVVLLAAGCLGTAAVAPLVIRVIAAGLSPVVPGAVTSGALKSPWVLQPVFSGFSILSPSWLWITMPVLLLAAVVFTLAVSGNRMTRIRRVPAWRSATAGVEGADCYTATGYANPARRVLAAILHSQVELRPIVPADGAAETGTADPGAAHHGHGPHLGYTSDVIEVVETYLYRPAMRPVATVVRAAKRLQSGRLSAYLTYMLIALIALTAAVTALG